MFFMVLVLDHDGSNKPKPVNIFSIYVSKLVQTGTKAKQLLSSTELK